MSEEYTKQSVAWAVVDQSLDVVQWFKEHLSFGSGDVHCVWVPEHPRTKGEHPRPDHAVLLAIVGNGPSSEANAKRIVYLWNEAAAKISSLQSRLIALEASDQALHVLEGLWSEVASILGHKEKITPGVLEMAKLAISERDRYQKAFQEETKARSAAEAELRSLKQDARLVNLTSDALTKEQALNFFYQAIGRAEKAEADLNEVKAKFNAVELERQACEGRIKELENAHLTKSIPNAAVNAALSGSPREDEGTGGTDGK